MKEYLKSIASDVDDGLSELQDRIRLMIDDAPSSVQHEGKSIINSIIILREKCEQLYQELDK